MRFGKALDEIIEGDGKGMRLPHWSLDRVVRVRQPPQHNKRIAPYLYVQSDQGRVPWNPPMDDMFHTAWKVV